MIRILVDSSSDYLVEEAQKSNIEMVPIAITLGNRTYIDGQNIERNGFFELLTSSREFPRTSQPSPQAFLDIFEDAKKKGDELIYIALSSGLSGTYQTAMMAKNMVDYENIYVIDSLTATFAIKILADHALKLAKQGLPAHEIAVRIEELKSRVKILAALDTLEYLAKGGRLSKGAAAIGNLANIKPVIALVGDGGISVLGKALGRNKAGNLMLQHLSRFTIDDGFPIYPIYSYGTVNCQRFEEHLKSEHYPIEKRRQIGPTIGTHIGPEAFGVIFVSK